MRRFLPSQIFQADLLINVRTIWHRTTEFGRISSVGERHILGSVTHLPQGRGPQRCPTFGVPFNLCTNHLTQNYEIWCGNTYGEKICFRGQPRPSWRDGVPVLPNFWGSLLFMRTPFVAELSNVTWQHRWGDACILGVSHASHPKTAELQGFIIFMPTPRDGAPIGAGGSWPPSPLFEAKGDGGQS